MVRTPVLSSSTYTPNQVPTKPDDISRFLIEELARISAAISGIANGHLDVTYVAPTKPRKGDIRIADGTSWSPGVFGLYCYNGTTWVLVKAL